MPHVITFLLWLLLPLSLLAQQQETVNAVARLTGIDLVHQKLGITSDFKNVPGIERIKIAVLDYGFDGIDGKRPYLPSSAVLVEHYDKAFIQKYNLGDPEFTKPLAPGNTHGRSMAQIVWGVTGHRPNGPQFYLLNANGPTLFRRAVKYAIEQKVDIILFSGVFEGAGNGDGRGFLNKVVNEALAAGIIWINAAGNYGRRTYEGPIHPTTSGELRFAGRPEPSVLRFRNRLDENSITLTLTWNDYREVEDAGTIKDLDMEVLNEKGIVVGSSTLKQIAGRAASQGETRNPRERIQLNDLPAGDYRVRIRTTTPQLWSSDDRLRLLIVASRDEAADPKTGEALDGVPFLDQNGKGEIYPPADNPLVIAVGDTTLASSTGATADHRRKPDVIIEDARATFSNGLTSTGASNAAAYFAGVVTILKAYEPRITTSDVLAFAHPRSSLNNANLRKPVPAQPPNKVTKQPGTVTTSTSRLPLQQLPPDQTQGANAPRSQLATLNTPGSASRMPFKEPWKMPTRQQIAERVGVQHYHTTSQPP
ncbi:MAG: S8 family serine peptidase [Gemmatales bacterium]